jgi:hypothetical protein
MGEQVQDGLGKKGAVPQHTPLRYLSAASSRNTVSALFSPPRHLVAGGLNCNMRSIVHAYMIDLIVDVSEPRGRVDIRVGVGAAKGESWQLRYSGGRQRGYFELLPSWIRFSGLFPAPNAPKQ